MRIQPNNNGQFYPGSRIPTGITNGVQAGNATSPANNIRVPISTGSGIEGYPVGVSVLSISLLVLIAFASNAILSSVTLARLGITVSISTLFFMAIIILILFIF